MMTFHVGTGLLGSTEAGQFITPDNVSDLPVGSVVRIGDGSRLIHLECDLWLWCSDSAWCYNQIKYLAWRLDGDSVACHVADDRTQQ